MRTVKARSLIAIPAVVAALLAGPVAGTATATAPAAATQAAAAAYNGILQLTNQDVIPYRDRLVFNKIQIESGKYQRTHTRSTVRLTNVGVRPLTVSKLAVTGKFKVASPDTVPFTIASGAYKDVVVDFIASDIQRHKGNLAIYSSSSTGPVTNVSLQGWWQKYSEHSQEPLPKNVLAMFGYKTVLPTSMYSRGKYQAFSSDEVLSPYWKRLNTSKASRVRQLAAFHTYPSYGYFRTFAKATPEKTTLRLQHALTDGQSILPDKTDRSLGTATFTPNPLTTFGFRIDDEFTDPKLNDDDADRSVGCTGQCGHHIRAFKLRDRDGNLVPGTYVFVQDFSGVNYDFNDEIYIVSNIKPAS
jgi:hypothetical protein